MTAVELLTEASRLGVEVWSDGDRLRCRAPKGALTPSLRDGLSEHKPEILVLLKERSAVQEPVVWPPIVPAPEDRYAPFPASDIQQAYWLGGALQLQ